jgi:predicted permease
VAVLTYRFWTNSLNNDPSVLGRIIRLDKGNATIIGVLEPSVPYPDDTEIIANMIASPHHMGATMVTLRTHRMTQLFGRLKPEATLDAARAELDTVHATMVRDNPESYSKDAAAARMNVSRLRDQIASPARTILLVLLAAAGIVFVIACSNVANLILARSVRREGELAVRAALGASKGALRRTLLAESLVLCGAGAALGVLLARPMLSVVAQFAGRFSVRALEVAVDSSLLWVGAGLAIAAAVLLAYVPKLPGAQSPTGPGLASGNIRITPSTNRRLRVFATTQIAFSFVMLAGAATLLAALIALQTTDTGYEMRQVLVADLPQASLGTSNPEEMARYDEMLRRIDDLPGVDGVSLGAVAPWRDKGRLGAVQFTVDGFTPADGEELPRAYFRIVTPGFFKVLDVPMYAGRDFNADDRAGSEPVVIVSKSFAERMFPNGDAINRKMWWVDPYMGPRAIPRRIVAIVDDVDDQNIVRGKALTVYQPMRQIGVTGRLFVHTAGDPYALVQPISRIVRELSPSQPFERPATLEDIRSEVLAPQRINAFVFTGFAGVALLIAVVGVAGVLAFGVSARTREFGVRLAIGSTPADLLRGVLSEGIGIVTIGVIAGAACAYLFAGVAASYFENMRMPGVGSMLGAAGVLVAAALTASLMPAARASRVDVLQALRSE